MDLTFEIKKLVIGTLMNDSVVSSLVDPDRIYGNITPSNPGMTFIRCEGMEAVPYNDSCGVGTEQAFRVHVFTDGEDTVAKIAAAVTNALNGAIGFLFIDWQLTQYLLDSEGEADAQHAAIDFDVAMTQ